MTSYLEGDRKGSRLQRTEMNFRPGDDQEETELKSCLLLLKDVTIKAIIYLRWLSSGSDTKPMDILINFKVRTDVWD